MTMRVEVGPVPSDAAVMWLAYARTVLAQVITMPATYGVDVSPDELAAFEAYLDEWELIANTAPVFHWVSDADAHKVKALADTWVKLADGMARAAEERGYELQPQEGKPFTDALAVAVITALAEEGLE